MRGNDDGTVLQHNDAGLSLHILCNSFFHLVREPSFEHHTEYWWKRFSNHHFICSVPPWKLAFSHSIQHTDGEPSQNNPSSHPREAKPLNSGDIS